MPGPIAATADPSLVTVALPALIALAGVLLTALLGFLQWRKAQAATKELEAEKLAHARDLLAWEKEKAALSQESDRERAAETAKADRLRDRREVQRAELDKARASRRESSTDAELAEQYRRTLAEQLKSVQILDMSRPLDLEKVYVQLTVREEAGQFAREREVRQLAEGDPREHLVRLLPEQQSVSTAPPDEALRRHQRIVVLGDPGSGKTTMLRHLALREAQGGVEAPVYVELRKFVDSGLEDLLTYVIHVLAEDYRFDGATTFIEEAFAGGDGVLLLDGLDEVLGGASAEAAAAEYDRIINDIGRISVRYPNLLIAVTCRRAGWRSALNSFATLEVVDFTWEHIGQFIDNWFRARPERGRQLRQALADNLRMQTLATNPLMLSLIAIVFERELELPERRAELYNRCAEVMLREWDSHRGIRRFSKFTTDRKRDLLQEVAWRFHLDGKRYFPQADLLDVIADYLPTIGIQATDNASILAEITAQYGMLKEQAHGWYGFLHLTMQEYFAAVSAAARGAERIDHVVRHRHDPWWEEVLVLQAGLVPDATGLLRDVLGWRSKKRRTDDIFSSDLLLAAQCLIGTPRIEDTGLRAEIMAAVEALILDGPSRFHRDRATTALVRIGTVESISTARTMLFDTDLSEDVRAAVARALCGLPGEQTRQDVERLLSSRARHGNKVVKAVLDAVATTRLFTDADLLVDLLMPTEDSDVKAAVVKAVASTGDRSAVPILHREFRDTSAEITGQYRFAVLEAIADLDGENSWR
ncbi:NACHT domain-containing protein [Actinosynnema sp. NPDC050801]|uniref:NACHT domain-containing protein n=1 Tax=unclassified Actinosynnema TaxID=2637065 RepID=UPI0033D352A2